MDTNPLNPYFSLQLEMWNNMVFRFQPRPWVNPDAQDILSGGDRQVKHIALVIVWDPD